MEVKALFKKILTGMEVLLEGQAAAGIRKRRLPGPADSPPPKRTAGGLGGGIAPREYLRLLNSASGPRAGLPRLVLGRLWP